MRTSKSNFGIVKIQGKKRRIKASCQFGAYELTNEIPERDVFMLRREFMLRNESFREHCLSHTTEPEGEILMAWSDIQAWKAHHAGNPLEMCRLVFGNIFNMSPEHSWTWYRNSFNSHQLSRRHHPCLALTPGQQAPAGYLTFSAAPYLSKTDAAGMFLKYFSLNRDKAAKESASDPLDGYFVVTEKRFNIESDGDQERLAPKEILSRYLFVYDFYKKTNGKCLNLKTWIPKSGLNEEQKKQLARLPKEKRLKLEADLLNKTRDGGVLQVLQTTKDKENAKKYWEKFPIKEESRKRTIKRYFKNAEHIITWAIHGRFPCTKPYKSP